MKSLILASLLVISGCLPAISHARMYGSSLCKQPGFHCVHVKRGQSWHSLWPDEHDRDLVMRINRLNIPLYRGMTIAVPNEVSKANIMDFSPFPQKIQAPQEKIIMVDPLQIAWGAYDSDGTLIKWGPISAGSDYCRDIEEPCHTHSGSFRIYSRGSSNCISHKFPLPDGGAPMPYCMYFNSGQALHGEPNGLPGYNASHGCVRLYVNDAEWLRYDFIDGPDETNEFQGTLVVVGPYNDSEDEQSENG